MGGTQRWERRDLGRDLRRLGLSYREIAAFIPVSKGTLSGWCRDIELSPEQHARLRALRPALETRQRTGAARRRVALERAEEIRARAREEARTLRTDPLWVAGVVAYWSEGAKRSRSVRFTNSDAQLVNLFVRWAERYLDAAPHELTAALHLHDGQDEAERQAFWSDVTGIPVTNFRKTYRKAEGSGHRKNVLYQGTITVRVRRSGDLLHRIMGWIDAVGTEWAGLR